MGCAEKAFAQPRAVTHVKDTFHGFALKPFRESRQGPARQGVMCRAAAVLKKFISKTDPVSRCARIKTMENSASPLLVLMIAFIVILALGVHAVFAGDPFYGSDVDLIIPVSLGITSAPAG